MYQQYFFSKFYRYRRGYFRFYTLRFVYRPLPPWKVLMYDCKQSYSKVHSNRWCRTGSFFGSHLGWPLSLSSAQVVLNSQSHKKYELNNTIYYSRSFFLKWQGCSQVQGPEIIIYYLVKKESFFPLLLFKNKFSWDFKMIFTARWWCCCW